MDLRKNISRFKNILICPDCRCGELELNLNQPDKLTCKSCKNPFPIIDGVPLLFSKDDLDLVYEKERSRKLEERKISLKRAFKHWHCGNLIDFLPDSQINPLLLNVGCGDGSDKVFLNNRGFEVVGIDISRSLNTDLLCDTHILPFKDNSFDIVTSIAVLEHLYNPNRAISEIYRVLKPNGHFVGSVAFLEPFHGNSYFHMTHLGLSYLLKEANFKVEDLSVGHDVIQVVFNSFIPRSEILNPLYLTVVKLRYLIRRLLFKISKRKIPTSLMGIEKSVNAKQIDRFTFAGSITFKALKKIL